MSVNTLEKFKKLLVSFLDDLIGILPTEGDLVFARIMIKDQLPVELIMQFFTNNLLKHKSLIDSGNDDFFLNDKNNIFGMLKSDKVNYFKKLWMSGQLSRENKKIVFDWFKAIFTVVEKYNEKKNI